MSRPVNFRTVPVDAPRDVLHAPAAAFCQSCAGFLDTHTHARCGHANTHTNALRRALRQAGAGCEDSSSGQQ